MNYWLIKSEPSCFGIETLKACENQTDSWDGVRNYQARNMMRDQMVMGDLCFFYHSNCKVPGIVGVAKVVSEPYPDHTAFDPEDKHYDPKSDPDKPRWVMVDMQYVETLPREVSLDELRKVQALEEMLILRKGNRLSITPISRGEWDTINALASS